MKQRTMLLDVEAVKKAIRSNPGPRGFVVDLVDHARCRIRIKRDNGSAYHGVTDTGQGFFMNTDTGQFDIAD